MSGNGTFKMYPNRVIAGQTSAILGSPNAPVQTRSQLRAALAATAAADPLQNVILATALNVSGVPAGMYGGGRQHGGGAFTAALAELYASLRAKKDSIVTAVDTSAAGAVRSAMSASGGDVLVAAGALTATSTVLFGSPSFPALSSTLLSMISESPDLLATLFTNTMSGLSSSAAIAGLIAATATVAVLVVVSMKFSAGSVSVITSVGRGIVAGIKDLYAANITEKAIACMESLGLITETTPLARVQALLSRLLSKPEAVAGTNLNVGVNIVSADAAVDATAVAPVAVTIPGTSFNVYGPGAAAWLAAHVRPGAAAGGMGGGYRKTKKHSRKSRRRAHRKSQGSRKTKSQRSH
jgi:hypothetical protein